MFELWRDSNYGVFIVIANILTSNVIGVLHFLFSDESFHFLLELSEEYQIEELKHQCIQYLHKTDKSGIKSTKYLGTAYRFDLTETVDTCIKEIASVPICIIEKDAGYQGLEEDLKNKILTTRLRNLESETNTQKTIMNSFRKYLYETANEGCCQFLREQGLEETVFSQCPLEEQHKFCPISLSLCCSSNGNCI